MKTIEDVDYYSTEVPSAAGFSFFVLLLKASFGAAAFCGSNSQCCRSMVERSVASSTHAARYCNRAARLGLDLVLLAYLL